MTLKILRNAAGKILRRQGAYLSTDVVFGDLYNWWAASDSKNICSIGWSVPTRAKINTLENYLGGDSLSGGKLKEIGFTYWDSPNTGATNEVGFNGRGGGSRLSGTGTFAYLRTNSWMWTNESASDTDGYVTNIYRNYDANSFDYSISKTCGANIRPLKDTTTLTHGQTGTYTDPSGITYPTICIGTQEWVACNIMTKHYRDGTPIPEEQNNANWAAATTGMRCSYNNLEANAGQTIYGVGAILCREYVDYTAVKYGLLYNWYAATDVRNICSVGWHVPTVSELTTLRNYLGGQAVAGGKLKETGNTYWTSPNTGATNEVGFNARGAGYRTSSSFTAIGGSCVMWANTGSVYYGYGASIGYSTSAFYVVNSNSWLKITGYSVRPMKDSTTLSHGQTGTYTDPSGFVYPTICIGTQEWVAMNIRTQHYRNGDPIPEVTDNAAWANLTTGALCAYGNNWANV